ncbi:hypothetical protein D9758_011291 [Tetrapyrgos nigripes]|uniref:TPR-like protein n=1 Tax=Tetrapyrgos nigripes TaxID=182062 RepID=A0A8H5CUQ6_9AGAR|nr:hypothetical protein D9758_011291 [Tetrapyrgos nigripes]
MNLATILCLRFDHTHEDRDIEEAVQIYQDILPSRSENSIPNRLTCLTKLATALQSQFEACQQLNYLDEAIQYWREAVEKSRSPPVLSSLLDSHTSLADALYRRFDEVSHIPDLEEAIALHHFTLSLRRDYHKAEDPSLHSLGRCLLRRFVHTSNTNDLEQAITYHRRELHCRPAGNDSRPSTLEALASALCHHYDIHGTQDSLDEAIVLYNQALQSSLDGRHNDLRVLCLSGLGAALHRCFDEVTGSTQDIDASIANHRRALELYSPHGRLRYKFLSRLAAALLSRIDHSGLEEDIHERVSLHCRIIEQCPPGSVD